MYTTDNTPYIESLGSSLTLKSVAAENDITRIGACMRAVFGDGEDVRSLTEGLIRNHPYTRPEYWLYIEEDTTGQVVSSLVLIPWTWRYEDVTIRSGEMGIVGTLPEYRHKGLIRALARRHSALLEEGEFDLTHIQGIPYFYRLLGYEYTLPLEGGWHMELRQIPDSEAPLPAIRCATEQDIPALMQLYNEAAQNLSISTVRDEAIWRYLFGPGRKTETIVDPWVIVDAEDTPTAYWFVPHHGFGAGLIISEASDLSQSQAMAVLRHAKALAAEREKPYLRLSLADNSTLIATARALDAQNNERYAWQIRVVDEERFLTKLRPIFERRIAQSPFAGLTRTYRLNLYRKAYDLHFASGKLTQVEAVGFQEGGDLRLPPNLLPALALGYRTVEELHANYPDVGTWGESRQLTSVLFQKVDAFLYTNY